MAEETALQITVGANSVQVTADTFKQFVSNRTLISDFIKKQMTPGVDFGQVPGTGETSKPSLFKPGAEKLVFLYGLRLHTDFERQIDPTTGHLTVFARTVVNSPFGDYLGDGSAVCSTRETKYAFKRAGVICPKCGKETVIKGKPEYNNGVPNWVCLGSKGGCNTKFDERAPEIINQNGQAPTNPFDFYNTVVKMAQKRSVVASVLLTTAASSYFTQDADPDEANTIPTDAGIVDASEAETLAEEFSNSGGRVSDMLKYFKVNSIYAIRREWLPKIKNEIENNKRRRG